MLEAVRDKSLISGAGILERLGYALAPTYPALEGLFPL